MHKEFLIREYREGDEKQIVTLLTSAFPAWSRKEDPLEHWMWKYQNNPLGFDAVVAVQGDSVIGVSHDIHLNIKFGDSIAHSTLSGDTVTHPDFRGKGVYSQIMVFSDRNDAKRAFTYSSSVNPYILKHRKTIDKPDRAVFPELSFMFRIKDIDLHFSKRPSDNQFIKKIGFKTLSAIQTVPMPKNSKEEQVESRVTNIETFDDKFDVFWNRIKGEYDFILEKNRKYLNWRYTDSRAGDYRVFQAQSGDEVLGFAVLMLTDDREYQEAVVSDLLVLPGRLDVGDALLGEMCRVCDEKGINKISYLVVKGNSLLSVAGKHGFVRLPNLKHDISARVIGKDAYVLRNVSNKRIYFSYGDNF